MSAASNRKEQTILSRKINRRNYVRDIRAAHDQTRLLMDHRVVNFASVLVIVIPRLNYAAPESGS